VPAQQPGESAPFLLLLTLLLLPSAPLLERLAVAI
jgi:hypothetical protein